MSSTFCSNGITGRPWVAAFSTALFAVHPLRVESVAWVAERKDLLSGLFFMFTLLAWVSYVKRPGWPGYICVLMLYVLGLLCKPMLVSIPFILLLLDYWPLRRVVRGASWMVGKNVNEAKSRTSSRKPQRTALNPQVANSSSPNTRHPTPIILVLEKLPLFALALASAAPHRCSSTTCFGECNAWRPRDQRRGGHRRLPRANGVAKRTIMLLSLSTRWAALGPGFHRLNRAIVNLCGVRSTASQSSLPDRRLAMVSHYATAGYRASAGWRSGQRRSLHLFAPHRTNHGRRYWADQRSAAIFPSTLHPQRLPLCRRAIPSIARCDHFMIHGASWDAKHPIGATAFRSGPTPWRSPAKTRSP